MSAPETPEVHITCVANIFSRQMHFKKAGDIEHGHSHCFDHVTLLARGRLQLTALGTTTEFVAPHQIYIKANVMHELVALEDDTVAFCIHAIRDFDDAQTIVDPSMLPAYQTPETFDPTVHYPMIHPLAKLEEVMEQNRILEAKLLKIQSEIDVEKTEA